MESIENCSLGKALGDECHKLTHMIVKQLLNFDVINSLASARIQFSEKNA